MSTLNQRLVDLENARRQNLISEEEYVRERERILNDSARAGSKESISSLGMKENNFLMLMHLSQFSGILVPGAGLAVPIILWLVNKDKSEAVDKHGKNILNFILSWLIYIAASAIFIATFFLIFIGLPLLLIILVLQFIFIIIATIQASSGVYWKYPLTIPFFY